MLFTIGAIFGSFCNVVVNRKIREESILYPPSHCETCGHRLSPADLVPIISYIFLRGRCRYCKAKIPIDNLIMEFIAGILTVLLFDSSNFLKSSLLIAASYFGLIIAAIDFKTFDIYMNQIVSVSVLGIFYRYKFMYFDKEFLLIIIVFLIIYGIIYFLASGGLGDGDIYYYIVLMLFITNELIIWFVFISIWTGAIGGIFIAIKNKSTKIQIPFCMYIYIAFIIIEAYLRFTP